MKRALHLFAVAATMLVSSLALAQTADDCQKYADSETICTFFDGSATVVRLTPGAGYSSTHYTESEWAKASPSIYSEIKAQLEAHMKASEQRETNFEARLAHDAAELKALEIHNKKKCLAAGFGWGKNSASKKDVCYFAQ
jgi:hypothetical protein